MVALEQVVTFVFPDKQGLRTGECDLRWRKDGNIQSYLHEPALKQAGLLSMFSTTACFKGDGTRVKKSYVPRPGDTIVFQRVRALR